MAFSLDFGVVTRVTIPAWTAAADFTLLVEFTTPGTLALQGLCGNGASADNWIAYFADGSYSVKLGANVVYTAPATTLSTNTRYTLEVSRTGGTFNITLDSTLVSTGSDSSTFILSTLGDTQSLLFTGIMHQFVLTGGTNGREYVNDTGTGTTWPDITSSQDGTLVGAPGDNSQWIPEAGSNGTITTQALKNNMGTVLSNVGSITVNVLSLVDGTLTARLTGQTTDGSGVLTFSATAIVPTTEYAVWTQTSTGDGIRRYTAT